MTHSGLCRLVSLTTAGWFILVAGCGSDEDSSSASDAGAGGTTADLCPSGLSPCAGSCVNLTSDAQNCGACNVACPSDHVCTAGECACPSDRTDCNGDCVSLADDPAHCGDCETACADGLVCSLGACASTCADGLTACGASCVDLATNGLHCGACGRACPAGQECSDSSCCCPAGLIECTGTCVDPAIDATNCGQCGNQCPSETSCISGQCTPQGSGGSSGTGGAVQGGSGGTGGGGTGGTGGVVQGGSGGTGGVVQGGSGGTGAAVQGGSGGGATGGTGGTGGVIQGGSGGTGAGGGDGGTSGSSGGGGCQPANCGSHKWACWRMPNPAGTGPNPQSYAVSDGVVHDEVTCLDWEQNPTGTYNQTDAIAHCDALSLGGYDDWRLPTRVEMASIVDFTRSPAVDAAFSAQGGYHRTGSNWILTITQQGAGAGKDYAWMFNLSDGMASNAYTAAEPISVRCVRGNGSGEGFSDPAVAPPDQYGILSDGEAQDNYTRLIWQRDGDATGLVSWEEAQSYCESLTLGGQDTWRLPTVRELATLVDEALVAPAINREVFPNTHYGAHSNNWYWASHQARNSSAVWGLNFDDGFTGFNSGSAAWNTFGPSYTKCVRDE